MNTLNYLLIKTPVETHKLLLKDMSEAEVRRKLEDNWSNGYSAGLNLPLPSDRLIFSRLTSIFTFNQIEYSYVSEMINKPSFHERPATREEIIYFTNKYFYQSPLTFKRLSEFIEYVLNDGYALLGFGDFNILTIRDNNEIFVKLPEATRVKQLPFIFIEELLDQLFSSDNWQSTYVIYYLNRQLQKLKSDYQKSGKGRIHYTAYTVGNTYAVKLTNNNLDYQHPNAMYTFNLKTQVSAYKTSKRQDGLIVSNNKTLAKIISTIDLWKDHIIGNLK